MDVMTIEEVSERCRIPVTTLRYWRYRAGGGPRSFKMGRRVVYNRADVEQWLQEQRDAAA